MKNSNHHSYYPFHWQIVQALQFEVYPACMEFYNQIIQNDQLIPCLSCTDMVMSTRDGVMNSRNSHSWILENPNETNKTHFQHSSSVKIWCRITGNRLAGPFVLERHLTVERYLNFLKTVCQNCLKMCYMTDKVCGFSTVACQCTLQDV